jgi:hypothetical protein
VHIESLHNGTEEVKGETASVMLAGRKVLKMGADNGFMSQVAHGGELLVGNSELEMSQGEAMSSAELRKAMEEIGEEEEVSKEDGHEAPGVEQLAAILEASPELSSVRRSKCRAVEVDEFVGLRAECRKSMRNEGIETEPDPTYHAYDYVIILNLQSIGVSLG